MTNIYNRVKEIDVHISVVVLVMLFFWAGFIYGIKNYIRAVDIANIDSSSPENSYVLINNDSPSTSEQDVVLSAYCLDYGSGVQDVRYANEDKNWSQWEPYNVEKLWTLSSGNGNKTVYYDCRDRSLNISEKSDAIILDSSNPSIDIVKPLYYHSYANDIDSGVDSSILPNAGVTAKVIFTGPLTIKANVSGMPRIVDVRFYITGSLLPDAVPNSQNLNKPEYALKSVVTNAPYEWRWVPSDILPTQQGNYMIKVVATDALGKSAEQVMLVTLAAPTPHVPTVNPSVSVEDDILLINNDAKTTSVRDVTLQPFCGSIKNNPTGDAMHDFRWVEFANEDKVWGKSQDPSSSFFNGSWTLSKGEGVKTVYQRCTDYYGNIMPEKSATIVLDSGKPSVVIARPVHYHTYVSDLFYGGVWLSGGASGSFNPVMAGSLTVFADVTDPVSTISNVQFYVNDTLQKIVTASPYQWTWIPQFNKFGDFTLRVQATDALGFSANESIVVTVVPCANYPNIICVDATH